MVRSLGVSRTYPENPLVCKDDCHLAISVGRQYHTLVSSSRLEQLAQSPNNQGATAARPEKQILLPLCISILNHNVLSLNIAKPYRPCLLRFVVGCPGPFLPIVHRI